VICVLHMLFVTMGGNNSYNIAGEKKFREEFLMVVKYVLIIIGDNR